MGSCDAGSPTWLLRHPFGCVLQAERIESTHRLMPPTAEGTDLDKTLLCFVLVDPHGKHAFCSRYDFGPWPLLAGVSSLPAPVTQVCRVQATVGSILLL